MENKYGSLYKIRELKNIKTNITFINKNISYI